MRLIQHLYLWLAYRNGGRHRAREPWHRAQVRVAGPVHEPVLITPTLNTDPRWAFGLKMLQLNNCLLPSTPAWCSFLLDTVVPSHWGPNDGGQTHIRC
jgi:hypothetical protein